jgi:Holliday junction resolvase
MTARAQGRGGEPVPTNYERGRALEYDARAKLTADGYFVIRSAGSKGVVDLCAIKLPQVLFVQCKRQKRGFGSSEWNALYEAAAESGALAILAERDPGKPIRWWQLTGPRKPRQRNELPREPFLIDFANDPLITVQSTKEIGEQI